MEDSPKRTRFMPDAAARQRLRRWRNFVDRSSRYVVTIGGVSTIIALTLIFVFLFSEVFPLLRPAGITPVAEYTEPGDAAAQTVYLAMERHREVGVRVSNLGLVTFFTPETGALLRQEQLEIEAGVEITSFGQAEARSRLVAFGLSDGRAIVVRMAYDVTFPDGERLITPRVEFPLEEEPIVLVPEGSPLQDITVQEGPTGLILAAVAQRGAAVHLIHYEATTDFLSGETRLSEGPRGQVELGDRVATRLLIPADMRLLFVGSADGRLHSYGIGDLRDVSSIESVRVLPEGTRVTAMEFLLGSVSLIVGGEDGSLSQWMPVRDDENVRRLRYVRSFSPHGAAVRAIAPSYARKGFITADAAGEVALRFSTSSRTLLQRTFADTGIRQVTEAPRADAMFLVDDAGHLRYLAIDNPHPQFSLRAVAGRVWYEGRQQPEHIWQSSSATDEFEPKFSLAPLTLGTLKAAFYAMLFAVPIALMAAIYSAYFMTARMRRWVKPTIEIMEALPTVILGFLAGLWMAPFAESNLPAVFSVLLLMPLGVLAVSFGWSLAPAALRGRVPEGWEAAALVPVLLGIGWFCVTMSPIVEVALFDGDMRQWLTDRGITYDQRNAMVVGFAMGFAVIPTIFSIAEDAIFNVPRHLTQGSLALGATPWQTLTRVVLLTASPAIFSAVMIGMGRAVGETMIVLMATGNSPVMNFNIFEGMRTLSANIAVEMPEAEVGGTHYRILFLSALLLLTLTFLFNTVAEIVRQRLRRRYASL